MIRRRRLLQTAAATAPFALGLLPLSLAAQKVAASGPNLARVRPGDSGWPSKEDWDQLKRRVDGRLVELVSPLEACIGKREATCTQLMKDLRNPYYLGDDPTLTQTLGWVDGWTSRPSAYAVAAETTGDVVAAVAFARENNLRLVVKGGGHSYQGTSSAPDSLLIWMRRMDAVALHDSFVAEGCAECHAPQPAVTVQAGAIWGRVYDAVTTKAGRYLQGGGCMTVGVAGLILSGGFGSFSKSYGMAAASLLEAEVVTADGEVRIANARTNPDLFWGIKGGGGGSFGVVTKVTLRTHDLPEFFGGVFASVQAKSNEAFQRLVTKIVEFYSETLYNPHWGEQIVFRPDNFLSIAMVFQGLDQQQAEAVWRPFFAWVSAAPQDFTIASGPTVIAVPARRFWDPGFLKQLGGIVLTDNRPGAPDTNVFWAGNLEEAGQVLHAYQSTWLPSALLHGGDRERLVDALFAASRHWSVSLHVNKGLAGAPAEVVDAARDTATNPAVLDAFALAISGAEGAPAYPGIPGHEPNEEAARRHARAVDKAINELRMLSPSVGSYVAESNFFEERWQDAFWGSNYPRLLAVKQKYDPDGLFFVHHGVGTERWSADGFSKQS